MLYQVTAYDVMGRVTVQVTTGRADGASYGWEHRILEDLELGPLDPDDPWDVLWAIADLIQRRALERGSASRRPPEPTAGG